MIDYTIYQKSDSKPLGLLSDHILSIIHLASCLCILLRYLQIIGTFD